MRFLVEHGYLSGLSRPLQARSRTVARLYTAYTLQVRSLAWVKKSKNREEMAEKTRYWRRNIWRGMA